MKNIFINVIAESFENQVEAIKGLEKLGFSVRLGCVDPSPEQRELIEEYLMNEDIKPFDFDSDFENYIAGLRPGAEHISDVKIIPFHPEDQDKKIDLLNIDSRQQTFVALTPAKHFSPFHPISL